MTFTSKHTVTAFIIAAVVSGVMLINKETDKQELAVAEKEKQVHTLATKQHDKLIPPPSVQVLHSNEQLTESESISVTLSTLSSQEYQSSSRYGPLPKYIGDIAMARLSFDKQGNLIVTDNIKQLIEHLLSVRDEEGYDIAVARIQEYIELALPPTAALQAMVIVKQYLAYKQNLQPQDFTFDGEPSVAGTIEKLTAALNEKKAIRQAHFSEEVASTFFDMEEAYDNFSINAIGITNNPSLSADQKEQHIILEENLLPERVAQRLRHKRKELKLNKQINDLKTRTGSQQEIHALRKDFYGEEIADRFAYLEDNSEDWINKVAQFKYESESIIKQEHLSNTEKQAKIVQSKNSLFTQKEQTKLAVQNIRGRLAQTN